MSDDNEYRIQINELRREIDTLTDEVDTLRRLVKSMRELNSLRLTAVDEEYLRRVD
jgi:hypothetical protein